MLAIGALCSAALSGCQTRQMAQLLLMLVAATQTQVCAFHWCGLLRWYGDVCLGIYTWSEFPPHCNIEKRSSFFCLQQLCANGQGETICCRQLSRTNIFCHHVVITQGNHHRHSVHSFFCLFFTTLWSLNFWSTWRNTVVCSDQGPRRSRFNEEKR